MKVTQPTSHPRIAYTRRSAAEALDVSVTTIKRLEANGKLASVRVGGRWLILADSLHALTRATAA
jgi:excisionase family DNA binding protein